MKRSPIAVFTALFLIGAASVIGVTGHAQTKPAPKKPKTSGVQKFTVRVTESGYQPAILTVKAGRPVQVTFVRKSEKTCGTEVLLPDYKIQKDLPLNKPVLVTFMPKKAGTYGFTCGMKMFKGSIIVK